MDEARVAGSILVAEHDASLRQVLAEVTRENFPGSRVYVARDAAEVLSIIPKLSSPAVAVLHWGLASTAGDECIRQLRAASVPVLITSAWDTFHLAQGPGPVAMLKTGEVQALLRKPFDLSEYIVLLKRLLAMTDADRSTSVLVVEDDADLRETVADLVEASGRRVFTATDGSDALQQLDGDNIPRPCLILLDWFMAPMSGKQFLERLRERPDTAELSVVIMTGAQDEVPSGSALRILGALQKPFSVEQLMAALDQHREVP